MNSQIIQPFADQQERFVFIDKTMILSFFNQMIDKKMRFHCVTMPSRFGKTYIAQMMAAYYSNQGNAREVFKNLKIGKDPSFESHLNKHFVINLDIAGICAGYPKEKAIERIKSEIGEKLQSLFPDAALSSLSPEKAIQSLNLTEKATFVFVIDEWDYLLRNHREDTKLFDDYILFLRSLFKNSAISSSIDLCYMTGIMPIKRYGSMSALNEFREYTMLNPGALAPYYGFTEAEAKETIRQSQTKLTLSELKEWYDGYYFPSVGEIYCPNSLVNACIDNQCRPYFGNTIADEAITTSLCNNKISLSAETALLFEGSAIKIANPNSFSGDLSNLDTKDKGLIALVHSGFLLFDAETSSVRIPNKEVRIKFSDALASLHWNNLFDGLYSSSKALLNAFLNNDAQAAASILDEFHYPLAGPFHHASEDNFAICVKAMLYDNGRYDVLSEPYMGYGRADLVYLPHPDFAGKLPAIIIELKIDKDVNEALSQIQERRYYASLKGYKNNILAIGINYDTNTKRHQVKIDCPKE